MKKIKMLKKLGKKDLIKTFNYVEDCWYKGEDEKKIAKTWKKLMMEWKRRNKGSSYDENQG